MILVKEKNKTKQVSLLPTHKFHKVTRKRSFVNTDLVILCQKIKYTIFKKAQLFEKFSKPITLNRPSCPHYPYHFCHISPAHLSHHVFSSKRYYIHPAFRCSSIFSQPHIIFRNYNRNPQDFLQISQGREVVDPVQLRRPLTVWGWSV